MRLLNSLPAWLRLLPALAALPAIATLHRSLHHDRPRLGLARTQNLDDAPPALAFTTIALGSFRGLIAHGLWSRAVRLQDEGNTFELVSLAHWITQLQPDNGLVWAMQAWNLSYNLSVQFDSHPDRWRWVRSGIELLRDHGIPNNPTSVDLYRELAWLYQDKIGSNTDYAHRTFKEAWAAEMRDVLGPHPGPAALANPASDDDRARADLLRQRLRLDPDRMLRIDRDFGPFDWRLPEPHAIYWAILGLERCRSDADIIRLRRVIWQNVERSFQRGRLVAALPDSPLEYGPNLDLIPNAWRVYEDMKKQEPGREDYIGRGQRNFIREAICLLYAHSRTAEAAHWFQLARTQFPSLAPPESGLEEFVIAQVTRQAGDGKLNRVLALLEGLLGRYYRFLALGDHDAADGHALLIRRIWESYQSREAQSLDQLGLPTLPQLQARVLDQIRAGQHGFTPALRDALQLVPASPSPTPNPTPAP